MDYAMTDTPVDKNAVDTSPEAMEPPQERITTELHQKVRELRAALTASEKRADDWKNLACDVHILESGDWLYSTENEPDWIARRAVILLKESPDV